MVCFVFFLCVFLLWPLVGVHCVEPLASSIDESQWFNSYSKNHHDVEF